MEPIKDLMIEFLIQVLKEVRLENKQLKERVREVESRCELYQRLFNDRACARARKFRMSTGDGEDIIDSLIPPTPRGRIECDCGGACDSHASETDSSIFEAPDSVS